MKSFLLLCVIMLFTACRSSIDNQFVIKGHINGAEDGEMVCLSYPVKHGTIWKWQRDTTYIRNEYFRFNGCIDDLRPASLTLQDMDYANIYIEPTKITFNAERNTLYNYSLHGLSIDKELNEYQATFGDLERKIWEKHHIVQIKNREWVTAYDGNEEDCNKLLAEFYALLNEYREISSHWTSLAIEFTKAHPNYTITPTILEQLIVQGYNIAPNIEYNGTMGELLSLRSKISKSCGAEIGTKALDFALKTTDNKEVILSKCYENRCVLLDFWASWCSPCLAEITNLRAIHSKYKNKLQVLSISIDKDKEQWLNAIKQYNLTEWSQLIIDIPTDADSYYFQEQSDLSIAYNVTQIPCFILIDTQGVVVGRWTHITKDIEKDIAEKLDRI